MNVINNIHRKNEKYELYLSPLATGMTLKDFLFQEGTISFISDLWKCEEPYTVLFLKSNSFFFNITISKEKIYYQRNLFTIEIEPPKINRAVMLFFTWEAQSMGLTLMDKDDENIKKITKKTIIQFPPQDLISYARKENLIETKEYETLEEFRNTIHSMLSTINEKISKTDSFKSFWNIIYDGKKIIERNPKSETEVQPLIQALIFDLALIKNIEIIPEYNTGAGNVDFLLIGEVKDIGRCNFCIEIKNAHSKDLKHGAIVQLPEYMRRTNSLYSAYCVLNYKGEWFDKPDIDDLPSLTIYIENQTTSDIPEIDNIRVFTFDFAKPITASKL